MSIVRDPKLIWIEQIYQLTSAVHPPDRKTRASKIFREALKRYNHLSLEKSMTVFIAN